MTNVRIPKNFDGRKFSEKFNLSYDEFQSRSGLLIVPSLPRLTEKDVADCIVSQQESDEITLENLLDALAERENGDSKKLKKMLEKHTAKKEKR